MNAEPLNPPSNPSQIADERLADANAVVRRNVLWSFGTGILPLPLFDLAAATVVQIKMIKELSNLYGVPFREDVVKKLLASLVSGALGFGVGLTIGASVAKLIPGIGTALGIVAVPLVIGGLTHATGQVFIMHFESGGTLLDFDSRAMRAHFKAEFESSRDLVVRMYEEEKAEKTEKAEKAAKAAKAPRATDGP